MTSAPIFETAQPLVMCAVRASMQRSCLHAMSASFVAHKGANVQQVVACERARRQLHKRLSSQPPAVSCDECETLR